jgi:putative PEP-CTERM system histidine kinase
MLSPIGIASHLLAALAFAVLSGWLLLRRRQVPLARWLAVATILTAAWAALSVVLSAALAAAVPGLGTGAGAALLPGLLETGQTAAFLAVLLYILFRPLGLDRDPRSLFLVAAGLGFTLALGLALQLSTGAAASPESAGDLPFAALLLIATQIVLRVAGLVLLHNIFVRSLDTEGPGIRFLAIGIGVIFAYDLNMFTLQFLLGERSPALWDIRGAAFAMAVPLLYLAFREPGRMRFILSREAAFNTISFSGIGLYLIFMSFLAYGLRIVGGDWGILLQALFLTATLIVAVLVILSPRFRAELRVRIARNFYRYRYDYRGQWLRFIDTIDQVATSGAQPIRERIAEAVASVIEAPGAALFERQESGAFEETARWNWSGLDPLDLSPAFDPETPIGAMAAANLIVNFDALAEGNTAAADRGTPDDATIPAFAVADRSIWLALPLVYRGRLLAILLVERSPVVRDLNAEDYDLLRTLGRQSASYLAEAASQQALDEARSFDEFNRRFAFVLHDLKNVVSQLGLVARNAERHIDNPEFRADLLATLDSSLKKMNDLLALLGQKPGASRTAAPEPETVDLARVASTVTVALRRQHPAITLTGASEPLEIQGDAGRLEAMITHLVQNAIDASATDAPISVSLQRTPRTVRIEIADRGHGMSGAFIRDELFRPFRSTKSSGFGVGAYEARAIAEAHGGRLEVHSRPGEGSRFTITLPAPATTARKLARA